MDGYVLTIGGGNKPELVYRIAEARAEQDKAQTSTSTTPEPVV